MVKVSNDHERDNIYNMNIIDGVPAIANVVTMQSAKDRFMNKVVVLFFLILSPIRVEMERVLPIVERITRPRGK